MGFEFGAEYTEYPHTDAELALELSVIGHKNGSAIEVSAVVDKFSITPLESYTFLSFNIESGHWEYWVNDLNFSLLGCYRFFSINRPNSDILLLKESEITL